MAGKMDFLIVGLGFVLLHMMSGTCGIRKGTEQTHCLCRGFLSRNSPVCDNFGTTHKTACALTDAMQRNSTMGLKCSHACPCKPSPLVSRCTQTMRVPSPELRSVRKRKFRKQKKADPRLVKKYCLTDGTEWTRNTIFCALQSKPRVGIRCMGFCKQCATINSACPAKFLQSIPVQDEATNP